MPGRAFAPAPVWQSCAERENGLGANAGPAGVRLFRKRLNEGSGRGRDGGGHAACGFCWRAGHLVAGRIACACGKQGQSLQWR